MKISFNQDYLQELYSTPFKNLGKQQYSRDVIERYRKTIDAMASADDLSEIAKFKGLKLEKLKSKGFKDCYSVRVNIQYRIIFKEIKNGQIQVLILELSKHYE